MLKLIDTHAHLDQIENITEELKLAVQAGVEAVVAVGVDLKSNQKNLELKGKAQTPKIFTALGIHPQSLEVFDEEEIEKGIRFIREHIKDAIAIGEIGLDFWYKWAKKDEIKKEQQRAIFKRQLEIAAEFNLPAIIHSRGTWKECLDMAQAAGIKKANFHWYSGPEDILDEIIKCGYFISASPAVAGSPQHQKAVLHVPIEQLLIETDSPVFYREGENGFRAGPKDVARTLKHYCALTSMAPDKAAEIFYQNSKRFFAI
ncbi:MAG: TatD family hydrolase [Candidatus Omnitrophota bacterium]